MKRKIEGTWNWADRKWRQKHPEYCLWMLAKQRAKKTGITFNIEFEDIVIPKVCPYLKTTFVFNTMLAPSLDRINPTKGYTKGNVEVISRKANVMKNNASVEELIEFACSILERNQENVIE